MLNFLKIKKICNLSFKIRPGFTLMELLVSMSIIVIVSGIFLANFHYGNQQGKVNMAAQKLASDIRLAQSYALGLKDFNGSPPDGGWGIMFKAPAQPYYILYADMNANHHISSESSEELKPYINFPEGIVIDTIIIDSNSRNFAYLTFEPPDPVVWICRNPATCNQDPSYGKELEIILTNSSGANTASVIINSFGLVDVKN
jgi:prepilin-type N-terminal cleavage/methylation domain-containing protein